MSAPSSLHNARRAGELRLLWPDGRHLILGHAQLRAACPCAQCRAGRLQGRIDLVREGVRLLRIDSQGYGVRLAFDDGHDKGIYPWAYLRELADR